MKRLQITSKRKAESMLVDSLFEPVNGRTLSKEKYSSGKYKPDAFPIGREVEVSEHVHALWAEQRRDADGAYACVYCLVSH